MPGPYLYGSSSGMWVTVCIVPFLNMTYRAVLLTLVSGDQVSLL